VSGIPEPGSSVVTPASIAGAPRRIWVPGRRVLTVGIVLTITMVAFEALAVATVMPLVERDLGDLHLYGWVFSAFFLGSMVGIVLAGRAADRMAPAIPFALGLVLFGIGLVVGGLAPSMLVLVAGRVLQGLGGGALPAVAYVCIGRGFPPEARPRMFAILSTAWVVPSLVGPALAGVIGETFSWRWVFLGLVPLLAVIGTVAVLAVRRLGVPAGEDTGDRVLGRALLVAAGGATVLAGLTADELPLVVGLVALGLAVGIPAFRSLTPAGTLRARAGLPAAVALRGLLTFSFFCSDAYVPYALTTVRGLPAGVAGLALTAGALTWTSGAWFQERRIHRSGPRPLVRAGFLVVATGVLGMLVVVPDVVPAAVGIAMWGVAGLGMGLAYAPISVTVLAEAAPGQEGSASAALQLSDMLGVALGTGVGGAAIGAGQSAGWATEPGVALAFATSVVVATFGAALARRLPARLGMATETAVA
jgi:MFS family permease